MLQACQVFQHGTHLRIQGAAHYLEHMLFMGNSKFKSEGELDAFLDRHGGSCNGFTEHQYVCLHFEVDEDAFAAALDRFAHLFISPRLTQDALEREVCASLSATLLSYYLLC